MLTRLWLWFLIRIGSDPRGLFRFFDGRRWRAIDPLPAAREFFAHPRCDWDEAPKMLETEHAGIQLEAMRVIADATREVLHILPVAEGGLTEAECLELFSEFRRYLGHVKKNGSLFPTSPDSTASRPSDAMPMPPTLPSASGSTPTEPSAARPGSPVEPTSA